MKKTNQVSSTIVLALTIGVSSLIGFGSKSAYAASPICDRIVNEALELDAKGRSANRNQESNRLAVKSAVNVTDKEMAYYVTKWKVSLVEYLGLIGEVRSLYSTVIENDYIALCGMNSADIHREYNDTFALEKAYSDKIAEVNKLLMDYNKSASNDVSL